MNGMKHNSAHFWVILGVWLLMVISIVGFEVIQDQAKSQNQKWQGGQVIVDMPMPWDDQAFGVIPPGIDSTFSVYTNTAIEKHGQWQGIDIQALDAQYPLLGEFKVSTGLGVAKWHDQDVYLSGPIDGIEVGDSIQIGLGSFVLRGYIIEQDEISSFRYLVSPRALMTMGGVKASGLWQPGSRVSLRYYFTALDALLLDEFILQLKKLNHPHMKISTPKDESTWSQFGFEKISQWHQSIVGVILLVVISSLWALTRLNLIGLNEAQSMMNYFGISRERVHWIWIKGPYLYAFKIWLTLTLLSLLMSLRMYYPIWPFIHLNIFLAVVYGLFLIWHLLRSKIWVPGRCILLMLSISSYLYAGQWIAIPSVLWLIGSLLLIGFLLHVVIGFLTKFASSEQPDWLLAQHFMRVHQVLFLSMGLVTCLMLGVFLLINVSLKDLEKSLLSQVPDGAPNVFLVNVTQQDLSGLQTLLPSQTVFYPVVRARITQVQGRDVFERRPELREDPAFNRELNMTYMQLLPDNNHVVSGVWDPAQKGFSVEEAFANRAGIGLGDELTVSVFGQLIHGPVLSVRKVSWQSMSPNFFVIAGGGLLADQVATWISSFHWDEAISGSLKESLKNFRHVTVIRVDQIILQVRLWLARLIGFANGYVLFIFAMMLFVVWVLLKRLMAVMAFEIEVLQSLMVPKIHLRRSLRLVFGLSQLASGLILNGVFLLLYRYLIPQLSADYMTLMAWVGLMLFIIFWAGNRQIDRMTNQCIAQTDHSQGKGRE